jgi:alkaline phosphatase D
MRGAITPTTTTVRWATSAAFRAWYEYNPISGDPTPPASPTEVRAYRSLRFGGVELFLTDQRSFRDDHVVPEGPIEESVGKTIENSPLGSRTFAKKDGFDILEAEARPSMLGAEQKQWLIDGVQQTDARWKVWASQLVVAQLLADLTDTEVAERFRDRFYFKLDHWDGFRTERREILSALANEERFVIFSGDLHGFYVSEVRTDYDDPASEPFAAEVTVSSISADTVKLQVEKLVNNNLGLILLGLAEPVSRFDEILQASNPHVRYSNSASYGVVIAEFGESEIAVRALELDRVRGETYPGVTRERAFLIGSRGSLHF